MFLKTLKLAHFRNYQSLDFEFKTPITLLVGDNAQGKSNFLESIYFLATTKSPKADREEELVREGQVVLWVEGGLKDDTNLEVAMQILEGSLQKRIKVNGIGRRGMDYCQNLVVMLFAPEDINLVTGSPSLRRDHIDATLSQIDRAYKRAVSNYQGVVASKNRVLKRIRDALSKTDELIFWTDQQVLLGGLITEKRQKFFAYLNQAEKKFGDFQYQYVENELSAGRLKEYRLKEIASATSLVGPHRDDFLFTLNGQDLAKYGSRGEQRTAVLDLKISEVSFIEYTLGSRPILLLDDIFSELDHKHQQHVLDIAKLQQTVITAVEFDEHIKDQLAGVTSYSVSDGLLTLLADK